MVPTEPAAETMPKASVRRVGCTTRAAMLAVMPDVVQASATPISTPAPSTIGKAPCAVAVSRHARDEHARCRPSATQRVPCLSASDAGERLAQAPGDLLHGDGQREVGDGDAQFLGGRRLEQAQVLPDAHGQGHHQGGPAQDGVGLPARDLRHVKGIAHGREDRGGFAWPTNELSAGQHERSSRGSGRYNPKSVVAHRGLGSLAAVR